MSRAEDADIIAEALAAIARDPDAALVAPILAEAWDGREFDEGAIRTAFAALRPGEVAQ